PGKIAFVDGHETDIEATQHHGMLGQLAAGSRTGGIETGQGRMKMQPAAAMLAHPGFRPTAGAMRADQCAIQSFPHVSSLFRKLWIDESLPSIGTAHRLHNGHKHGLGNYLS